MFHRAFIGLTFLPLLVAWLTGEPAKPLALQNRPAPQAGCFLYSAAFQQAPTSTPTPGEDVSPTATRARRPTPTPPPPTTSPHHPGLIAGGMLLVVIILIGILRFARLRNRK